jgi:flagellar basal-body rod protein FlgB
LRLFVIHGVRLWDNLETTEAKPDIRWVYRIVLFCAARASADRRRRPVTGDKPWYSACFFLSDMLDGVTSSLERYMDLLSARQKLVASNIANADTPGYQTQDVDFQFEFMTLAKGEQPQTIQPQGLVEKPDGNNVNLDREASLLSENQMRFNLASVLVHGSLKTVLEAIQGGSSS